MRASCRELFNNGFGIVIEEMAGRRGHSEGTFQSRERLENELRAAKGLDVAGMLVETIVGRACFGFSDVAGKQLLTTLHIDKKEVEKTISNAIRDAKIDKKKVKDVLHDLRVQTLKDLQLSEEKPISSGGKSPSKSEKALMDFGLLDNGTKKGPEFQNCMLDGITGFPDEAIDILNDSKLKVLYLADLMALAKKQSDKLDHRGKILLALETAGVKTKDAELAADAVLDYLHPGRKKSRSPTTPAVANGRKHLNGKSESVPSSKV